MRIGTNAKRRRWFRVMGWALLAWLGVVLIATALLAFTDRGRRLIADAIEDVVSDQIPGSARIGRIESLGSPLRARDFEVFHPNGRRVLHVEEAAIHLDPLAMFTGKLVFDSARAEGGELTLWIDPDGRSSLEGAFMSKTPDPDSDFHYALRNIDVEDLRVTLDVSDGDPFYVEHARGLVTIARETTDGVRVDLNNISGHVAPKLAGMRVRLMQVDGWVHGKERQVLMLWARALVDDGKLRGSFALFDREQTPVEVVLDPREGAKVHIAAWIASAASLLTDDVKIAIRDDD